MTCHGTATVTYRGDILQHIEFCCEGTCPEGAKCCVQISRNQHGGTRMWCGCGPEEPKECHLVLITPGPGEGGGQPELVCAGSCPKGQRCEHKKRSVQSVTKHWCECAKE
jgi:hypothetical protein